MKRGKNDMSHNETHAGTWGWAGIAVGVYLFDHYCEESLSHAFKRGMENPRSRPLVLGALAITASHLICALPERYDPFLRFVEHRIIELEEQ